MLTEADLRKTARARLRDAQVLLAASRYDGAAYLCGYAVEIALKAAICRRLRWAGFPETRAEFEGLHSFKTHHLDVLLQLSGAKQRITTKFLAEWSAAVAWDPEARYGPTGNINPQDAALMVQSVRVLVNHL